METACWYCNEKLPFVKRLKGELFCSKEHEEIYFQEQSVIAFKRLTDPNAPSPELSKSAAPTAEAPLAGTAQPEAVATPAEAKKTKSKGTPGKKIAAPITAFPETGSREPASPEISARATVRPEAAAKPELRAESRAPEPPSNPAITTSKEPAPVEKRVPADVPPAISASSSASLNVTAATEQTAAALPDEARNQPERDAQTKSPATPARAADANVVEPPLGAPLPDSVIVPRSSQPSAALRGETEPITSTERPAPPKLTIDSKVESEPAALTELLLDRAPLAKAPPAASGIATDPLPFFDRTAMFRRISRPWSEGKAEPAGPEPAKDTEEQQIPVLRDFLPVTHPKPVMGPNPAMSPLDAVLGGTSAALGYIAAPSPLPTAHAFPVLTQFFPGTISMPASRPETESPAGVGPLPYIIAAHLPVDPSNPFHGDFAYQDMAPMSRAKSAPVEDPAASELAVGVKKWSELGVVQHQNEPRMPVPGDGANAKIWPADFAAWLGTCVDSKIPEIAETSSLSIPAEVRLPSDLAQPEIRLTIVESNTSAAFHWSLQDATSNGPGITIEFASRRRRRSLTPPNVQMPILSASLFYSPLEGSRNGGWSTDSNQTIAAPPDVLDTPAVAQPPSTPGVNAAEPIARLSPSSANRDHERENCLPYQPVTWVSRRRILPDPTNVEPPPGATLPHPSVTTATHLTSGGHFPLWSRTAWDFPTAPYHAVLRTALQVPAPPASRMPKPWVARALVSSRTQLLHDAPELSNKLWPSPGNPNQV